MPAILALARLGVALQYGVKIRLLMPILIAGRGRKTP
jgi:hypothetical protein